MSPSKFQCLLCTVALIAIAGCGGKSTSGGGGGGTTPTPTVVTFTFTTNPTAVATQIGAGSYTQATVTSGKLTLSIPNGETKFSIAYLCPPIAESTPASYEYIQQFSTLDGTSFPGDCFQPTTPQTGTATLQVDASAIPGTKFVAEGFAEVPWLGSPVNINQPLQTGTYDIPISASSNQNLSGNYLAIRILRNQTVPGTLNSGDPVVFTDSDKVQQQTISTSNLPAGFTAADSFVTYQTANLAEIVLNQSGSAAQYLEIPAASVQTGDYYFFNVSAFGQTNGSSPFSSVAVERYSSTGGPQSFTYPAPWSYSGPAPAPLPTFNLTYSGFSSPRDEINFGWTTGANNIAQIYMVATANYQNGSTTMTIPDLSGLSGFLIPPASGQYRWNADLIQGTFTKTTPPSGTIQLVGSSGTYTLP